MWNRIAGCVTPRTVRTMATRQRPMQQISGGQLDDAQQRRFTAELLRTSAAEAATHAAALLVDRSPSIERRYAMPALDQWRANMLGRVHDLASAIEAGDPAIFAHQVQWAAVAFAARKTPLSDLVLSLECLAEQIGRELPDEDRSLIDAYFEAALRAAAGPAPEAPSFLRTETPQGRIAGRYLLAILEGDRRAAVGIIDDAAASGICPREIYTSILRPVAQEIGRLWHLGDATVAEEHFATATTQLVMGALYSRLPRATQNGKTAVAAGVEGDAHELGIRMVADFLEMDGWRVIYLGVNVPADDLAQAVEDYQADMLMLSATLVTHLVRAESAVAATRARRPGLKVIVGGGAFTACPGHAAAIGANGFAKDASEAAALARRLCGLAAEA